jgi:hypothetical protein
MVAEGVFEALKALGNVAVKVGVHRRFR